MLNGGNKETLLGSRLWLAPTMLFLGLSSKKRPSGTSGCPVLLVSPASPSPASLSFPGHKWSMLRFFFSAHEIQAQFCTSSFPGKLFSSCEEPCFFIVCLHFSAILEAGRRVPGQAAAPGLPGTRARVLSPRGCKTQGLIFFFLTRQAKAPKPGPAAPVLSPAFPGW